MEQKKNGVYQYICISEKCKKFWGAVPILFFLTLKIIISLIEVSTDSVLRSIPQMILSWFGGISIGILIFWTGRSLLWKNKGQVSVFIRILRRLLSILFFAVIGVSSGIGFFVSVFFYSPEHVVVHNGIRMVASVNSFLQETVSYYEYKGILFHGAERIGWEDYGNGGGDPFEQGIAPDNS